MHFCTVNIASDFDEFSTKNSLLGQHFKSQLFGLTRELALKQRKKYIKNRKVALQY